MTARIPGRGGPALRWVHAVSGGLYLIIAVLLVYFRLAPFAGVAARLRERGTPLPAWFALVFTLGVGLVAFLFAAKGLRLLRRARRA
jgi:hypothetical protein